MVRKGKFGGMLNASSVLNSTGNTSVFRFASSQMREAAKIGLQSLYADPEKVLEKYKDFDIVKAMRDRRGAKLLWVRARAIDADKVNTNGDFFDKEELLKEVEYKGSKVPAYKTFEGVPIYTNHKNDDIELAKGMVVYSEWDDKEDCVYCTFFIDEDAYPDIARAVRHGYIHDVSMGCSVLEGECSICKNIATTEKDWCDHLKRYKGKKDPETNKPVYEKNRGIKFIELSCVGDGAFDSCEIHELYEPEEILAHAETLEDRVAKIHANISIAASIIPEDSEEKYAYENCLRQITSALEETSKIAVAQLAGNLVGGEVLGSSSQNATVSNILQFLGLDAAAGLNILDLLNLSLNFMEVAVMNLFSKKDNIDLAHVGKITKAMADLQNTMQDLIDDGVNNTNPQGAAPAPAPGTTPPATTTPSDVGNVVGPSPVQPGTPAAPAPAPAATQPATLPTGFGGGVGIPNTQFASRKNILQRLAEIKSVISEDQDYENFNTNNGGLDLMSFLDNLKQNFNSNDFSYEVSAPSGHKIAIASNSLVKAFIHDEQVDYCPTINTEEKTLINNGDIAVAAPMILERFVKMSAKITETPSITQQVNEMDRTEPDKFVNQRLEEYRTNSEPDKTLEERTMPLRNKEVSAPVEEALDIDSWVSRKGTKNKIKEKLLSIARRGIDNRILEERLEKQRLYSNKNHSEVVDKVITALANTAIKNGLHPKEILAAVPEVLDMGPDALSAGKEVKETEEGFPATTDPSEAVVDGLSDQIDDKTTSADILSGLSSSLKNLGDALSAVQNAITEISGDEPVDPKLEDTTPTDDEMIGAEVSTKADAASPDVSPQDVQATVSSMANTVDQLGISNDQAIDSVKGMSPSLAHKYIEMERSASATAARNRNFERISFFGFNRKPSKKEIVSMIFGNLASYANDYKLRSKNLATAITSVSKAPEATKHLLAQALSEKRNIRTAGVTVNDSQVNQKTIHLNVSDLGGIKLSDPDFQNILRRKVIEVLGESGYDLDPNTFSMNEVVVSPDGDIEVHVFTRFERQYEVEASMLPGEGMENHPIDMMEEQPQEMPGAELPLPTPREAKKAKILGRYAQALPALGGGGGLAAPGGAAPGAANPAAPGGAAGAADPGTEGLDMPDGPGIGAFTADPMAPTDDTAAPAGDTEFLPGVKKPWGSVCPQCQSTNVDVTGGEGKCNDCGAQLKYEFSVHVVPPAKNENYKGTLDPKTFAEGEGGMETPMGVPGEVGLGAATAEPNIEAPGAAPAVPPAPGAGPAAPPAPGPLASREFLMTRISYITEPEVFVNANNKRTAAIAGISLPVGMTCPFCSSRNVDKAESSSWCNDCKTLATHTIEAMVTEPDKLISRISWISPKIF